MATQTRTIPLTSRQRAGSGISRTASEAAVSNSSAPVIPPVSRKKQASVLASAFLTIVLTIGYNQSYGVFQQYYLSASQNILSPSPSSQATPPTALVAFVGTLGSGLTWGGSILVNPLLSRIEYGTWSSSSSSSRSIQPSARWRRRLLGLLTTRSITLSGVFLMAAGLTLASFSTSVWQLLLTQGFLYGLGSSLLYFPLLSPAPEYFTTHRATALGFILAGGGVGGLAFSPAIRALLNVMGGRWTLRVYALFVLVVGIPVAWAVPRSRFSAVSAGPAAAASSGADELANAEEPESTRQRRGTHVSRHLVVKPAFLLSAVAAFLQSAGAQLPLSFIPSYSVALGLASSKGANLLAASNAINAVSRVATGYLGDRLGRQNTLVLTVLLAMASVFAFWQTSVNGDSDSLWLAFIIIYSVSAGGYYALFPATIAEVFGIRQYAAVNGFIYFIRGLGTMFGSPVGGQLLGKGTDGPSAYAKIVYWDGALLLGATICLAGVRYVDARGKGWNWVA
ncbi:major facilitator superfamily domain-containing protein [Xylariaceae sp. FL0662B]|nr:major facilitator superfamily domain-containing protein [Xylariaceae sp. FL0662B]